jgi:hypothetical protein
MAQTALYDGSRIPTLATSYLSVAHGTATATAGTHASQSTSYDGGEGMDWEVQAPEWQHYGDQQGWREGVGAYGTEQLGSTGKGILIGMLSAFGSAALVALLVAIVYFFRYTARGRILLDRIGRPGEFDDEQQFLRDEEEALAEMSDLERAEYHRAKGEYRLRNGCGKNTATDAVRSIRAGEPA